MTEATTETPQETRRSTRPANGNASISADKATIEVLADKLYRALVCAKEFASAKAKSAEHTFVRFVAESDAIAVTAYDGKIRCDLVVPTEGCTKPSAFCLQVRSLPTIIKMLSELHQEEREKTGVTLAVGKRYIEVIVDGAGHRVPYTADAQLEIQEANKVAIPERSDGTVLSSAGWPLSPSIAGKLLRAATSVSSGLKQHAPRAADSPIIIDIAEGKAGITGFFVLAAASLAKPQEGEEDDRNEEIDFEDDDDTDDDSED